MTGHGRMLKEKYTMSIHNSSIISPQATMGKNVKIGPFCVVGPNVTLGDNVELKSHIVIEGVTSIGDETIIYPFASIGTAPQDLKYAGEPSKVVIGRKNIIREYVTIQPGTSGGGMQTIVGDGNLFMIGTHIAHDCVVGNNCIFANNATLAGHVVVGDGAVMGGLCAVRQYVRIGTGAMIGGLAGVAQDVLPYMTIAGERAWIEGVNIVGMKRRGFDLNEVHSVQDVIKILFDKNDRTMEERLSSLRTQYAGDKAASVILDFVEAQETKLGYCVPREKSCYPCSAHVIHGPTQKVRGSQEEYYFILHEIHEFCFAKSEDDAHSTANFVLSLAFVAQLD